jgi:hypothetical protein
MDVVRKIENIETGGSDVPKENVIISAAKHEKVETPFAVHKDDAEE